MDTTTGTILFEKNADQLMPPSSMSKMMTVYVVFERLKDNHLSLDDTFRVSEKAWRKRGSKMWVRVNSRVRVEDLLRGIIVQSGNDASIVVAEGISGTESAFAEELNRRARELGMTNSYFVNASGWPHEDHMTTARDLAALARATIEKFPEYYHYYAEKSFTYNGIKQANRNPTLDRNLGADGLKTGHTNAAGYGLTTSAIRNGRRLILVLNGLPSSAERATEAANMLDWGYQEFANYTLFKPGEKVTDAKVWMGTRATVGLVIEKGLTLTLARKARKGMTVKVAFDQPVPAPIKKGDRLAILKVDVPGREHVEVPLLAGGAVERLGLFSRLAAALKFILWGDAG
jgi:D-alanyl-D-alanine carboxypeptidase (penicillin-binding protein 5/6)